MPRSAGETTHHAGTIAALRTALGEEAFAAEWAAGRALTLEQVLAGLDRL
jgi:hypothetical protein